MIKEMFTELERSKKFLLKIERKFGRTYINILHDPRVEEVTLTQLLLFHLTSNGISAFKRRGRT